MLKKLNITKYEKNRTKPGNPYYLVLFENRTKLGTVPSETVLSGDPLYYLLFTDFLGHNRDQTVIDVHSLARFENFVDILVINPKNVLGTFFHESIIRSDFNGCSGF